MSGVETSILIEIVAVSGSAPRGPGAAMLVSASAEEGTIGGGALEWMAIAAAREMLARGEAAREIDQPLGPELGQCCGGRVRLRLSRAGAGQGLREATRPAVLVFGAGHVGAALARMLAPLPLSLTVVDERAARLAPLTGLCRIVETALPEAEAEAEAAPAGAAFVILTHDHALDFMIAEAALRRGDAAYVGMIGSATKRAALASRLARAGLSADALTCPVGAAGPRDKRPEIIALATAAEVSSALFRG